MKTKNTDNGEIGKAKKVTVRPPRKVNGLVKSPPQDAAPVMAEDTKRGTEAKAHADAVTQGAITTRAKAKGATKVKTSKAIAKVKPAPTPEQVSEAQAETANAIVNYDPALRDAHAYGHDSLAGKVATSLKDYAALIGAPVDSYALLIIQRGGVALPPLRKVWDKAAGMLGIEPIPGKREYSDESKVKIRELYNATKKAQAVFLSKVKSTDTAKTTLRGTKSVKDNGDVKHSFTVVERTNISTTKLIANGGATVFARVQETTSALVLNVAKSHVFNAQAMVHKPDRARFAIWRKSWKPGDALPSYCAGHRAAGMMDVEETALPVAFDAFTKWASDSLKAKKAEASAKA